jgi:hypothetical protein
MWFHHQAAGPVADLLRKRAERPALAIDGDALEPGAVFTAVGVRIIKTPVQAPPGECDRRTLDRQWPPRVPGPDADHR